APLRRAAARRDRARDGSALDAPQRRADAARRDPLPQDQPGHRPDDLRAGDRGHSAARRALHQIDAAVSRGAVALLALASAACSTTHVHLFGAYRYEMDRDCLESPAVVDVIDGPDPGMCAMLRCWISPGKEVYVTDTACDSPPDYAEHTS